MAKLNGVVLTAEAIEYNGEKYEKVEGEAKVGDIVRSECERIRHFPNGAFYSVNSNASATFVVDEDGDKYCGVVGDVDFTVFRKVTEPVTESPQQYREVNREANVGERIKIVAPETETKAYEVDDILTVKISKENGVYTYDTWVFVFHREYVVLEPIAPIEKPSDDLIVVDGVTYRKVDRKPKVGDFVYATSDCDDITQGKVYDVIYVHRDGDACFCDNVGDQRLFTRTQYGRILVERVAAQPQSFEQLTAEVEEAKRKLAEAEKQLAEKQAEEAKAKDPRNAFAAGDKVRLISGGGIAPLYGYHNGEVYTVSNRMYPTGSIEITGGGQRTAYAKPEQLEKVSEEDIAEANRMKVGEYAKVIRTIGIPFKLDEIVEIVKVDQTDIPHHARSLDGNVYSWVAKGKLVRATDEEVAEAKRKLEQAEEAAQWAKIGRKPNEYKNGDIVEVTFGYGGIKSGDIGVITIADGSDCPGVTVRGEERYCPVKLIAPVESVVNLTVSA